jgi:uncharacterized membrane protein
MTPNDPTSHLLDEYLAELERAAADLPVAHRAELLADIRTHVAEACAETDDPAGAIPAVLAQLGDPAEIVAAARTDPPPATAGGQRPAGRGALEATAVVLLVVCGLTFLLFFPLAWIGWLSGLTLLCVSRHWTLRDKLIGFAGVGLAPVLLSSMTFLAVGSESCSASSSGAPVTIDGTVTAAEQTTMQCTQDGGLPPAVANAIALLLIAGVALTLRHLSGTRPRTGLPAS